MFSLTLEARNQYGKELSALRMVGRLPVVFYGPKEKATSCLVGMKEFKKIFKAAGESSIISLHIEGEEKDALIHDVAVHPVTGEPIHADFYVIEKGKKLRLNVPLEFTGVSLAVKSLSGVLLKVLHEIEIEALPRDLPHNLTVDISKLATFEDQILVKDISIPSGVTVMTDAEEVVALVNEPKEEVLDEAAPVDLSKIETSVEKGKKEEEGAPPAEENKEKKEKK